MRFLENQKYGSQLILLNSLNIRKKDWTLYLTNFEKLLKFTEELLNNQKNGNLNYAVLTNGNIAEGRQQEL